MRRLWLFAVKSTALITVCLAQSCNNPPPAPPNPVNFALESDERIFGLPPTYTAFVGVNGKWNFDSAAAYGTVYVIPSGVAATNQFGQYYCVSCRVFADWTFGEWSGPCAGEFDINLHVDMDPGDRYHLVCVIDAFGFQDNEGWVVTGIPDDYWDNLDVEASPPAAGGSDTLTGEQWLNPDQSIYSADGRTRLIYQLDGNLVLYQDGSPVWASNTVGTSLGNAKMQLDGNFVVYDASGTPVWASGTQNNSGAYLGVYNGGSFFVFKSDQSALYWSGTGGW
jgi:hypothetical protein